MARERPTASNDDTLLPTGVDAVPPIRLISDGPRLTRAEAHALARSAPLAGAPLTPEEFRTRRRLAERGISPLERR